MESISKDSGKSDDSFDSMQEIKDPNKLVIL